MDLTREQVGNLFDLTNLPTMEDALNALLNLMITKQGKGSSEEQLFGSANTWIGEFPKKIFGVLPVFENRIQNVMSPANNLLTDSFAELVDEPKAFLNAAYGTDFFYENTAISKKDDTEILREKANAQHKQLYYCLYVIALTRCAEAAKWFYNSKYRMTLEQFKSHHADDLFVVNRKWNKSAFDKEKDHAGGDKEKPAKKKVKVCLKMSETFDDNSWRQLFQFRNLFVLCFIISPKPTSQKNIFTNVASILIQGKRAALGGSPSEFIPAVKNVIFAGVTEMMFDQPRIRDNSALHQLYDQQRAVGAYDGRRPRFAGKIVKKRTRSEGQTTDEDYNSDMDGNVNTESNTVHKSNLDNFHAPLRRYPTYSEEVDEQSNQYVESTYSLDDIVCDSDDRTEDLASHTSTDPFIFEY